MSDSPGRGAGEGRPVAAKAATPAKKRGGARPNAGRKAGGANAKTRLIADKAMAEGITPLEVMLRTMREMVEVADALPRRSDKRLVQLAGASGIAKDAAPYCHPRLNSIEHSGKNGGAIKAEVLLTMTPQDAYREILG